jgi:hypothetical protein
LVSAFRELEFDDLLHFVELDEFRDDWRQLGLDDDRDLLELQLQIMADPTGSPVIAGTGGLRKLRFVPRRWQRGKSGAVRVCYVHFAAHWTVLLVMAYGKNRQETITAEEKQGIREYIERLEVWFANRKRRKHGKKNGDSS